MRPDPMLPETHDHCRATYRLRVRAREAEAQAAAARAETAEIEAEMRALRADIRAERAALTEFIESSDWHRDLLTLARDRVRAEMITLSTQRKSCGECGGFGRGLYDNLLCAEIDMLTREHRLLPEPTLDPIDWPVRMGTHTRQGRALRDGWLRPATVTRRTPREASW